jgi:uracil DNA glycosylase
LRLAKFGVASQFRKFSTSQLRKPISKICQNEAARFVFVLRGAVGEATADAVCFTHTSSLATKHPAPRKTKT